MKKAGFKSGSALLVVLGMLAFMVVSAVAFSAYMRYSRLPSSYLRRTTASRELAKAALARAIDEIDHAIGENVHPGIGARYFVEDSPGVYRMEGNAYKVGDDTKLTKNYWRNNIYIGTNFLQKSFLDTAPVLTLEGLAYIPPPYVDLARYYGRLSSAAEWKTFDFDAGRYAFVAIDVSDALDVNRLSANMSRSSAGNGRISLAYLFENNNHTSAGSAMSNWDEMMEKYRDYDSNSGTFNYNSKIPLTSVADLNMAIGSDSFGDLISPWYKYVSSDSSSDGFYCGRELHMHRMPFVTDSYFPTTNDVNDINGVLDLAYGENQPFDPNELMKADNKTSMDSAIGNSSGRETWKRLRDSISLLGLCSLWDYLDVDSYPISLALPTLERVPMIAGLKVSLNNVNVKINEKIDGDTTYENESGNTRTAVRTYLYTIDGSAFGGGLDGSTVESLAIYPFCRDDGQVERSSYTTEGYISFFLSDEDMPLSPDALSDSLKFNKLRNLGNAGIFDGVITLPFSKNENLTPKAKDIKEESDAIVKVGSPMLEGASSIVSGLDGTPLLKVTIAWQQEKEDKGPFLPEDPDFTGGGSTIRAAESSFTIYNKNGSVKGNAFSDIKDNNFQGGVEVVLNTAVAMGVKTGNEYVDLVPACAADDTALNNRSSEFSELFSQGATGYPLMRMDTGVKLKLSVENLHTLATGGASQLVTVNRPVLVVDDPVYNHAPASWHSEDSSWTFTAENWLTDVKQAYNLNDIFRNTSDQGYMQSVYELAFIPRVAINNSFDQGTGNYSAGSNRNEIPTDRNQILNRNLMWGNYSVYDEVKELFLNSDNSFSFSELGLSSGDTGYHINPYSSNIDVVMSAFMNTPLDWAAASTNFDNRVNKSSDIVNASENAATFNRKYAWCGYNPNANLDYLDIETIVEKYAHQCIVDLDDRFDNVLAPGASVPCVCDGSTSILNNWEKAWAILWIQVSQDAETVQPTKELAGLEMKNSSAKFWNIDREFLYGYWKECFAVRQQLFLIFVRAEPMMMGGGSMSKIPPQLGARAVALVWRDPTPYDVNAENPAEKGNLKGAPHRTRVLFYKTLD